MRLPLAGCIRRAPQQILSSRVQSADVRSPIEGHNALACPSRSRPLYMVVLDDAPKPALDFHRRQHHRRAEGGSFGGIARCCWVAHSVLVSCQCQGERCAEFSGPVQGEHHELSEHSHTEPLGGIQQRHNAVDNHQGLLRARGSNSSTNE